MIFILILNDLYQCKLNKLFIYGRKIALMLKITFNNLQVINRIRCTFTTRNLSITTNNKNKKLAHAQCARVVHTS